MTDSKYRMASNYLDKEHFASVIRRDQGNGTISEELVTMFVAIGKGVASKLKLCDPETAETLAMETLVHVFKKMNPDLNCFGYASQCCRNAFRFHYTTELKHFNLKMALRDQLLNSMSRTEIGKMSINLEFFPDPDD